MIVIFGYYYIKNYNCRVMINVLVYPCASGIGQELYNALYNIKDINLYGANSDTINIGEYLYRDNYIPCYYTMNDEELCIQSLHYIVNKYKIHCIFPAFDDAQVWLKRNESKIGAKVITSSLKTTQVCRSKKTTYELLHSIIRCPLIYSLTDTFEYPIFIKPDCGEGAKGCYKINNKDELTNYYTQDHILLEYLPGDEYTVDCFTDSEGILQFIGPRKRSLTKGGISVITNTIHENNEKFMEIATKINDTIELRGAWFFQVKHALNGELCLLEIAPRVSGAMSLYREQCINFPLLSIYLHMGLPTTILYPKIKNISCCKIYTNHFKILDNNINNIKALYVDLDDTLIDYKTNSINTHILNLIYIAKQKMDIILITRHKSYIPETFNKFCIHPGLFSDIIHIKDNTPKSKFIIKRPSIFIDDSFRERLSCKDMEDVYTFDIDSINLIRDIILSF